MEIEQYLYDLTDSGDAIVAYTMRSASGGSLQICNLGATILSFSLPDGGGVVREVASGYCVRSVEEITLDREAFRERLWESRVEVNRVVMSLSYDSAGVGVVVEVIFDFDDDNTFEVTCQACTDGGSALFDMSHVVFFEGVTAVVEGLCGAQNLYDITDAKRGILSKVAELHCPASNHRMEMLSSYPSLYYDADSSALLPIHAEPQPLAEGGRYVQKVLYRVLPL